MTFSELAAVLAANPLTAAGFAAVGIVWSVWLIREARTHADPETTYTPAAPSDEIDLWQMSWSQSLAACRIREELLAIEAGEWLAGHGDAA